MANLFKDQVGWEFQSGESAPVQLDYWLVDDDVMFLDLFVKYLELDSRLNCTHKFVSAPLVLAALKQFKAPAVILLDIQMPEMTGMEALPLLKKLAPDTTVLILTDHFDPYWRERAMSSGASGFLRKSEPISNIIAAMHAANAKRISAVVRPPPPLPSSSGIEKIRSMLQGLWR
jgi:DNA-binding NarL/FixJ family response regulator